MRALVALAAVVVVAVVARSAPAADFDGKLSCKGTTCTFTVKNTTGKALIALSMIWTSSAKLVKVSDPQARPTTYFDSNNQQKTTAPGECVVFPGASVGASCTYAANVNEPGWLPNTSRTLTFTLASPATKGTKVSTCAQAKLLTAAADCSPQDFDADGTTSTAGGAAAGGRADVEVEIQAETPINLPTHGNVEFRFVVLATNVGKAATAGRPTLVLTATHHHPKGFETYRNGDYTVSPACGIPKGFDRSCLLPKLAPGESKRFVVLVAGDRRDYGGANAAWVKLEAQVTHTDPGDPKGNDRDTAGIHVRP